MREAFPLSNEALAPRRGDGSGAAAGEGSAVIATSHQQV